VNRDRDGGTSHAFRLRATRRIGGCSRDRTLTDATAHRKRGQRILKEVSMLVLSRKLNEKIVIDGNITITVVKVDRNQVRLGIEAPGHVPVFREEILPPKEKQQRNSEALAVCS
jgi:carbon storage regulator